MRPPGCDALLHPVWPRVQQAARAAGGGGVRPRRAHPEQRDEQVDRAGQLGTSAGTAPVPHTARAAQVRAAQVTSVCGTTPQAPERTREAVKEELVDHARQMWPLDFSRFYEVTKTSGEST